MSRRLISLLSDRPLRTLSAVFACVLLLVTAYFTVQHSRRVYYLRKGKAFQFVTTYQQIPDWIDRIGGTDYVPDTMYRSVDDITCFSDDQFKGIASCFDISQVRSIKLFGRDVTDAVIPLINETSELESLSLTYTSITAEGLEQLNPTPLLTFLTIYDNPVNDEFFADNQRFPMLEQLMVHDIAITDRSLEHISQLENLETLMLYNCPNLTGTGVQQLSKMTSLNMLMLRKLDIDISSLNGFELPPQLNFFTLGELSMRELPRPFASRLASHETITALRLEGLQVEEKFATQLVDLPHLTSFEFSGAPLPDSVLYELRDHTHLHALALSADALQAEQVPLLNESGLFSLEITLKFNSAAPSENQNYDHLAQLKDLKEVEFNNIEWTQNHIDFLKKSGVATIRLRNVQLSEERLSWIRELPELKELSLLQIDLTAEDLSVLASSQKLTRLFFYDNGLDDRAVDGLTFSPPPEYFQFIRNNVSPAALERFIDRHPDTEVWF